MATNSNTKLRTIVEACLQRSDLAPQLAVAGSSLQPALDIANEVMNTMIRGGAYAMPDGRIKSAQRMNWKWNRLNCIPNPLGVISQIGNFGSGTFLTNAFQQDYAVPGIFNVDWIEEAPYFNINTLQQPKQVMWADPKRNLSKEYVSTGTLSWKICFLPNSMLDYGIWGQTAQQNVDGLNCPGPGVTYTVPLGAGVAPNNPVTQIVDSNGNLYALTTYGACGSSTPAFPSTVTYPTTAAPTATATQVSDGTCVWTALNPNGMGFRLSCPPYGNSVVWLFRVVVQMLPPIFTSLNQTLGVLPDDLIPFFRNGFEALCIHKSNDPKVRARFEGPTGMWSMWIQSLQAAVMSGTKEQEDQVMVPDGPQMSTGMVTVPNPLYPFMVGW
jgi:hypothetical protein